MTSSSARSDLREEAAKWSELISSDPEEFAEKFKAEVTTMIRNFATDIALGEACIPHYITSIFKVDRGEIVASVLQEVGKEFEDAQK